MKYQYEMLNELVELIAYVVVIQRKSICIGGAEYLYELIMGKFIKLDLEHICYILDSMKRATTYIANIKVYILVAPYNTQNIIREY